MLETETLPRPNPQGRKLGTHSRPDRWAKHDGRKTEGKILQEVRDQLTQHVGGSPSITQRLLIERTAWLVLHISMLDGRALREGGFSSHATKEYLSWCNTLRRSLVSLGLKGEERSRSSTTLSDLLAGD